MEKKHLKEDDDFDFVFFVFDKDSHNTYDSALDNIQALKKNSCYKHISIKAITSNPCFELWLKLHVKLSTKPYKKTGRKSPAESLISELKKMAPFKDYSKGNCAYFEQIKNDIPTAKKNAKLLYKEGKNTNQKRHHINPSTFMHELVSALKSIKDSQS